MFLKRFPYLCLLSNGNLRGTVLFFLSSTQDAILEADTEFWISVCCEFSVQHQIQSLMTILEYLLKLPEEKEGRHKSDVNYCLIWKLERSRRLCTLSSEPMTCTEKDFSK